MSCSVILLRITCVSAAAAAANSTEFPEFTNSVVVLLDPRGSFCYMYIFRFCFRCDFGLLTVATNQPNTHTSDVSKKKIGGKQNVSLFRPN